MNVFRMIRYTANEMAIAPMKITGITQEAALPAAGSGSLGIMMKVKSSNNATNAAIVSRMLKAVAARMKSKVLVFLLMVVTSPGLF